MCVCIPATHIKKQNKYFPPPLSYQDNQYTYFCVCHSLGRYIFATNVRISKPDSEWF